MKRIIFICAIMLLAQLSFSQVMCMLELQIDGQIATCLNQKQDMEWTAETNGVTLNSNNCYDWAAGGDGIYVFNLQELVFGNGIPGQIFTISVKVVSSTCLTGYAGTIQLVNVGGWLQRPGITEDAIPFNLHKNCQ